MTPTKATKAGNCKTCSRSFAVGDLIDFVKGARQDGSTYQAPIHAVCPGPVEALGHQSTLPPVVLTPEGHPIYTMISAWVQIQDAPKLLDCIKTLKNAERPQ